MKVYSILTVAAVMSIIVSCKKDKHGPKVCIPGTRKVQYELYTDKNFAGDKANIEFRIFMQKDRTTILDSALATMKVEDIPAFANRIIIEKQVPNNDFSTLSVGFTYHIQEVGNSSFKDRYEKCDTFKLMRYSFK